MKKLTILLIALALVLVACAAPAEEPPEANDSTTTTQPYVTESLPAYYHTTANLHLRESPSTEATSLALVPRGTRVQVLDYRDGEWFGVRFEEHEGYMYAQFLSAERPMPDPYFADNSMVWNIAPTLAYGEIWQCSCGIFLTIVDETAREINPETGALGGPYTGGHGGGGVGWVYDPTLNLLGHPGVFEGYDSNFGMHPVDDFEESVAQAFPGERGVAFAQDSSRRMIVQRVDATQREELDADWGGDGWWRLTDEARLGRFAFMENRELISPWFDAIIWGNGNGAFAARQGETWQLIDHTGEALLPFAFEHLLLIDETTAFAKVNGYYGILNLELTKQQFS